MKSLLAIIATWAATLMGSAVSESLEGDWYADAQGFEFYAVIVDDEITIDLVMDDVQGLYWTGDYVVEDGYFVSTADTSALAYTLFGSFDETKEFKMHQDTLVFEFGIMGTTRTVELERK